MSNAQVLILLDIILLVVAYIGKWHAFNVAKKIMETQRWPLSDDILHTLFKPRGYLAESEPVYGSDAIKIGRSFAIMSEIFLWVVIWSSVIFGLFLIGK